MRVRVGLLLRSGRVRGLFCREALFLNDGVGHGARRGEIDLKISLVFISNIALYNVF